MQSKYFYVFLLIISLIISIYFARSTFLLYSAKNTLIIAQTNLSTLKDENTELKKEIAYRQTEPYIINEAREKLNYGFEGDRILIVPKEVSKDLELSKGENSSISPSGNIVTTVYPSSNIKMWLDLFF